MRLKPISQENDVIGQLAAGVVGIHDNPSSQFVLGILGRLGGLPFSVFPDGNEGQRVGLHGQRGSGTGDFAWLMMISGMY